VIQRNLKKIELCYIQQDAGERNVKIKCQIVKTNGKTFKYGGQNVKWKRCHQIHNRELRHTWGN